MAKTNIASTKTAPLPPKYELRPVPGKPMSIGGNFEIPLEVRAFKDGVSIANEVIVLKHDFSGPIQATTNATGTCNFLVTIPASNAGRSIEVRIYFGNRSEENLVVIPLPDKVKSDNLEADNISVRSWIVEPDGTARINLRLIGDRGEVLKNTLVKLVFEGKGENVTTDELGHAEWQLPRQIVCNERILIIATANNIAKECELKLWNAPVPSAVVTFNGLVNRLSFIALAFLSALSFIVGLVSFIAAFHKSPLERVTSDSGSGVGWIVIFLLCLIPPAALLVNVAYYFIATRLRRIKEEHDYTTSRLRKGTSGDPWLENVVDFMKEAKKSKDKKTDNKLSSSASGSEVIAKRSFFSEVIEEFFAEGLVHGIGFLVKKFK